MSRMLQALRQLDGRHDATEQPAGASPSPLTPGPSPGSGEGSGCPADASPKHEPPHVESAPKPQPPADSSPEQPAKPSLQQPAGESPAATPVARQERPAPGRSAIRPAGLTAGQGRPPAARPLAGLRGELPEEPGIERRLSDVSAGERLAPTCDLSGVLGPIVHQQEQQYREAARSILAQSASSGQTVLMFLRAADEDDTETVLRLAVAMAGEISGELVLVDCDPRRPALSERLGVHSRRSLSGGPRGTASWREAVCETTVPKLHVLRGDHLSAHGGQPPESSPLAPLLEQLRHAYRLVLVDAGSAAQPEGPRLARACDGAYLIVRLHQVTRRAAREALRRIERSGGKALGCVVTGAGGGLGIRD